MARPLFELECPRRRCRRTTASLPASDVLTDVTCPRCSSKFRALVGVRCERQEGRATRSAGDFALRDDHEWEIEGVLTSGEVRLFRLVGDPELQVRKGDFFSIRYRDGDTPDRFHNHTLGSTFRLGATAFVL